MERESFRRQSVLQARTRWVVGVHRLDLRRWRVGDAFGASSRSVADEHRNRGAVPTASATQELVLAEMIPRQCHSRFRMPGAGAPRGPRGPAIALGTQLKFA